MDKKKTERPAEAQSADKREEEMLLKSLRAHKQVVESDRADAPLGPGQTHVYVKKPGQEGGELIERRKSLIKR